VPEPKAREHVRRHRWLLEYFWSFYFHVVLFMITQ
jgi:hypothetical protein